MMESDAPWQRELKLIQIISKYSGKKKINHVEMYRTAVIPIFNDGEEKSPFLTSSRPA